MIPIGPGLLTVDLGARQGSDDPSAWTLTSATDPDFAAGRHPTGADRLARADGMIPDGWPYTPTIAHEVLLAFDRPLQPGATYVLSDGTASWELAFDPTTTWSSAIKVNQVGLLSDVAGRHAYVSTWLAGLPPLALADDQRAFHVVDATSGATVLTGELTLRLAADAGTEDAYGSNYARANVYDADLTALVAPGDYFLVWDGVGRSFPFAVGPDVWDAPFLVAFHGLFQQRCGGALDPRFTTHPHGACHQAPVTLTTADYFVVGEDAFTALPAASTGEQLSASGGYHDAGDYDRNGGHLALTDALVDLYDLHPTHDSDALGLPESNNGIPDLLDEAAWGLSTWRKLQGDDGGVRGGVGTTAYPDFDEMPDEDDGAWYAYAEDPLTSYRFAGAAAKYARAVAPFAPDEASDYRARAERAWTWAEANPRGYDTRVAAVTAAAELFRSTGDAAYEQAFLDRGPFAGGNLAFSLADWDGDEWNEALYTYASTDAARADARAAAVRVLTERADAWIGWGERTGYRLVKHPYAPITNGTGSTPTGAGLLLRVHALTGDPRYREWAAYSADLTLGANPAGLTWTTGLGQRTVRHPLDTPTLADGLDDPVPGLTLYGPNYATSGGNNTGAVLAAFDPPVDQWPLLERYADATYVPNMNEFTVVETLAPTVFAFGALASWSTPDDPGEPDDSAAVDDSDGRGRVCGCAAGTGTPAGLAPVALTLLSLAWAMRPRPARLGARRPR